MGGRTGYPDFDNNINFGGPEFFTAIEDHFDGIVDPSLPTASALPASGNWPGRTIFVEDTKRTYQWNATDGWVMLFQVPTAWTNLPLATGWNVTGAPWVTPSYRLNQLGEVEVRGQMTPKAGYLTTTTFATLPNGFRPPASEEFTVINNGTSPAAVAGVVIDSAGNMTLFPAGVTNVNFGQFDFAPA